MSASVYYDDAKAAIEWLCNAFGFEVRLIVETGDGGLAHSELVYGEAVIMVAQSGARPHYKSPKQLGGTTQGLMLFVDDLDAHYDRARKAGGVISVEPQVSDYGEDYWTDRSYAVVDPGGHHWWFCQRLKTGDPNWDKVRNKRDRSHHEK